MKETLQQRTDRINAVVLELLKLTTSKKISAGDAMEVAIRLAASIAIEVNNGDQEQAATYLAINATFFADEMRKAPPPIKVVNKGETVQ